MGRGRKGFSVSVTGGQGSQEMTRNQARRFAVASERESSDLLTQRQIRQQQMREQVNDTLNRSANTAADRRARRNAINRLSREQIESAAGRLNANQVTLLNREQQKWYTDATNARKLSGMENITTTENMAAPSHILRRGSSIVSSIGRSTGRSSASQRTGESEKLTTPQRISQAVRNEERFSISNGRLGSIEFKPTHDEVIGRETYSGKEQTAYLNEFELDKSLMNKLSRVTSKKAAEKLLKEYSGNDSAYGLRETDKHYIFTVNGNDSFALRK